jgi:hypothetical protein
VNEPDTIVLTRKGYDQIISPTARPARQFVYSVIGNYVTLFLGFGFRDSNIDSLLHEADEIRALGSSSVYALIPTSTRRDRVLDQNLKSRKINPIYVERRDDHGVSAIREWLVELTTAIEKMSNSRTASTRGQKSPDLLLPIEALLMTNPFRKLLAKAVAQLSNRPDLVDIGRSGLTDAHVAELFDIISVDEARLVLSALNRSQRSPLLEDALSCLPPACT